MPLRDGGRTCRNPSLRIRLSILMFLAYLVPGAVVPLFSAHLQGLGFHSLTIGLLCATQAAGAVCGALFMSQAADRWVPANRCLILCSLLVTICLGALSVAREPVVVFVLTLLLWLLYSPIFLLAHTITFTLLPAASRSFGGVRVWGTFGWMVSGWIIGLWLASPAWLESVRGALGFLPWDGTLTDGLRLGTLFALTQAVYATTLPYIPLQPASDRGPAPLAAYRLLRGRSFITYCVCVLGVCLTFPVTMQATPLLLSELGISRAWLTPTLTLAQSTELLLLPFLALILARFGFRGSMMLGLSAWALALVILAFGRPLALIVSSQVLNGFCLTCFLIAGQVYVNQQARPDLRASVQGMLSFVNNFGQMLGHFTIGIVREANGGALSGAFLLAAVIGLCLLPIFYLGFSEPVLRAETVTPPTPAPTLQPVQGSPVPLPGSSSSESTPSIMRT